MQFIVISRRHLLQRWSSKARQCDYQLYLRKDACKCKRRIFNGSVHVYGRKYMHVWVCIQACESACAREKLMWVRNYVCVVCVLCEQENVWVCVSFWNCVCECVWKLDDVCVNLCVFTPLYIYIALTLDNPRRLICYKNKGTKPDQTKPYIHLCNFILITEVLQCYWLW